MLSRSIGYQPIYGIYLLFPSSPPPQPKYFISKSLSPFIHRPDIFLLRIFSLFFAIIKNSGLQGLLIGSHLWNALGVVLVVDDLDGYLLPLLNRGACRRERDGDSCSCWWSAKSLWEASGLWTAASSAQPPFSVPFLIKWAVAVPQRLQLILAH